MTIPTHIAIVGDNMAAWMTAAFLLRVFQSRPPKITVFCGGEQGAATSVQAVTPEFLQYLQFMHIPESVLLRECAAEYMLGTHYKWLDGGFIHSWGDYGAPRGAAEFHQILIRLAHEGHNYKLDDLSVACKMASLARFAKPVADSASIFSTYEYSMAFCGERFVNLIKTNCIGNGVVLDAREVAGLQVWSDDTVEVKLSADEFCKADWVVNTQAALASGISDWESWVDYTPFVRQQDTQLHTASPPLISEVEFSGLDCWTKKTASQTSVRLQTIGPPDTSSGSTTYATVTPGCVAKPWSGNLLQVGDACVRLASPVVSEADLAWLSLKPLLQWIPSANTHESVRKEYNGRVRESFVRVRDTTQLIMMLAARRGGLVLDVDSLSCSDELRHKLALFDSRGKIPYYENEIIKPSWQTWLCLGFGCMPKQIDPITQQMDSAYLVNVAEAVQRIVAQEAARAPVYR